MKTIQICETNKCVVSECQFAKMKISYKFGISVCTRYSISNTMVMFYKGTIKAQIDIMLVFNVEGIFSITFFSDFTFI